MGLPYFVLEREICIGRHEQLFLNGACQPTVILSIAESTLVMPQPCRVISAQLVTVPSVLSPYPSGGITFQCTSTLHWRYSTSGSLNDSTVASEAAAYNIGVFTLDLAVPAFDLSKGSALQLFNWDSESGDIGLSCSSYFSSFGLILQAVCEVLAP